jgi:dTDP-4-dehydrorhamnose reductase
VDPSHPLRTYLLRSGATHDELAWHVWNACPPDTIGANYYVTSDRVLDHRLDHFPPESHGGNGRQAYADIAAVRASPPVSSGFAAVLERYWTNTGGRWRSPRCTWAARGRSS